MVMKRNVGSTVVLTTVRFSPYRSAIAAPIVDSRAAQRIDAQLESGASRIASMSITLPRSATYALR